MLPYPLDGFTLIQLRGPPDWSFTAMLQFPEAVTDMNWSPPVASTGLTLTAISGFTCGSFPSQEYIKGTDTISANAHFIILFNVFFT